MKSRNLLFLMSFLTLAVIGWNINIPIIENERTNLVEAAEPEKVTDLVCGMEISKDSAKVINIDGKNFYFCSDNCMAKFEANPWKVTCMCFVGLKEGDEPCDCNHCSGKGGRCDCSEHGGHKDGGHHHAGHDDEGSDGNHSATRDEHSGHDH